MKMFQRQTASTVALRSPPSSRAIARSVLAPGWWPATIMITLAGLVLGVVFARDVSGAVRVWMSSTAYNHCFLILPLTAFLLWERRTVFSSVSPRPTLWPLLVMPLLSAVWLIAAILDIQEGRQLALVAIFQVVLLATLGINVFRLLLAPCLFLFFLVPSGAFLVPALQKITAQMTVAGLNFLHIPVFSDGFIIEIPEGSFEVAEACAGLRFLIASSVFGCFFAVLVYRSFVRRALFIILSTVVPIAANGLRALGIVALAHFEGSATAVEADHVLYGWLFFSLVIMALIAIGMIFAQKTDWSLPQRLTTPYKPALWRLAAAALAAVLLASVGPAYAVQLNNLRPASALSRAHPPSIAPPWHIIPGVTPNWQPAVSGADEQFLDEAQEPGSGIVTRYVALYRLRATGNLLTTMQNRLVDDLRWHIAEYGRAEVSLDGKRAAVSATEIVNRQHRRLVWSFYVVGGRITSSILEAKLLQARATLLESHPVAAFIAVSANMDDPQNPPEEQLTRFLTANEDMAKYVQSLH
jgi:exosortase A